MTATSVALGWTASTDNVAVAGYDVVRVSGTTETTVAASTTNSVTVTGLTASTAYTFGVYARDAAGNRSARSATVNVTTSSAPSLGCTVAYRIVNEWPGGFQGDITLGNTGATPINGWTLAFAFANGQTVSNMWGGTPTQSGATVSVTPASYTTLIPAGGSVNLGFTGVKGTTNAAPTAFTLTGSTCTAL